MSEISIEVLRKQIDGIDDKILQLLSERFALCDAIGLYKKQNQLSVVQNERFAEVLRSWKKQGSQYGLSEELIEKLLQLIHEESINIQRKL